MNLSSPRRTSRRIYPQKEEIAFDVRPRADHNAVVGRAGRGPGQPSPRTFTQVMERRWIWHISDRNVQPLTPHHPSTALPPVKRPPPNTAGGASHFGLAPAARALAEQRLPSADTCAIGGAQQSLRVGGRAHRAARSSTPWDSSRARVRSDRNAEGRFSWLERGTPASGARATGCRPPWTAAGGFGPPRQRRSRADTCP